MNIKENFLIEIHSVIEPGEHAPLDPDSVELLTRGDLIKRGSSWFICYQESEATGYPGTSTTVRISEDARQVTMTRFGRERSQLVFEKGTRHICHYDTGYGPLTLGVAADEIRHTLEAGGGEAEFSYTLDTNERFLSRNHVQIKVKRV